MLVKLSFDTYRKLCVLGVHSKFDVCAMWEGYEGNLSVPGIYHAASPSGKIPLLKVLFTNRCERNCGYCSNRKDRDRVERVSFDVFELVRATEELYEKGFIKGLFLSSGVGNNAEETFVKMGEVAKILRHRGFRGYIHLKVLPGVPLDAIAYYQKFASRMSFNLEAPSTSGLEMLMAEKSLWYGLKVLSKIKGTTQFVVDYGTDSDVDYLKLMAKLFSMGVCRVYFKAFVPISHTPMEHLPEGSRIREKRLYEASFLIQRYGFFWKELLDGDRLPLNIDVKTGWALRNPHLFPVDLAIADYRTLIRVPGIGPKTARRILNLRRKGELDSEGLRKILPSFRKTAGFAVFKGRRLTADGDKFPMLPLFSETGYQYMPCGRSI